MCLNLRARKSVSLVWGVFKCYTIQYLGLPTNVTRMTTPPAALPLAAASGSSWPRQVVIWPRKRSPEASSSILLCPRTRWTPAILLSAHSSPEYFHYIWKCGKVVTGLSNEKVHIKPFKVFIDHFRAKGCLSIANTMYDFHWIGPTGPIQS